MKYAIGALVGIVGNPWIALSSLDILMMLILPLREHGLCFHFFVSSSASVFSVLLFSECRCVSLLVKFIPRHFFDATENGIVFLVFLSGSSLVWCIKIQLISGTYFVSCHSTEFIYQLR